MGLQLESGGGKRLRGGVLRLLDRRTGGQLYPCTDGGV
jgi:hypothetical protein